MAASPSPPVPFGSIGPNLLYRNDGALRFTEVAATAGLAWTGPAGRNYRHAGPTFADMDGDGDLDLFLGGLGGDPSLIFRNDGDGTFTDVSARSGVDIMRAEYSFSAAFGDYDLDGDLDLAVAHWGTDYGRGDPGDTEHLWRNDSDGENDRSRAFENDGAGTFNDIAGRLGIDDREFGRGVVCADFDTDGDVDILLLHDAATLWENRTSGNSFLRVELRGTAPNTAAAGARITVRTGAGEGRRTLMREITIGSNYLSQNPPTQVFGLGAAVECAVEVEWPDGQRTQLTGVAAGQTLRIEQPAA